MRSALLLAAVAVLVVVAPAAAAMALTMLADLEALYGLRASLGLRARDWPRRRDPCREWRGVTCGADGRVVGLNLSGLRRTRLGRLAPRFAVDRLQNLTHLQLFNASGFPLPGTIPPWLGGGLAILDLSHAAVLGPLPPSLGGAAALSALYLSGNNISGSIPDTFAGLQNLTVLDLSSNLITGPIPPSLGKLQRVMALNLFNNQFTGSLPPQLGNLSSLASLDLSSNLFQGSIPDSLKNLVSLQIMDLSNNSFSGQLPNSQFSGLSSLQAINFSHNGFQGQLQDWVLQIKSVDLSYNNLTGLLPELPPGNASGSVFNLSNNLFYGSVTSGFSAFLERFSSIDLSGNYFEGELPVDVQIKNVSFYSNCFNNVANQRSTTDCKKFYLARGLPYKQPSISGPAPLPPTSSSKKSGWDIKYILIGVFGGIFVLLVLALVVWLCLLRCGAGKAERREDSDRAVRPREGALPSRRAINLAAVGDSFTHDQLLQATSEFSESNLIKHGHSGDLYHGVLEGGVHVVVRRIDVQAAKKDAYLVELDLFAHHSHMRIVPFLGHCLDNENEKFLVYKYMPNSDLSNALYRKIVREEDGLQSLDWITRLKIATGVAEALCFLHHECTPPLVHRDVQASSILLDDKFEVRLGSLSEVCPQESEGQQNVISRFLRLSQSAEQGASGLPAATCSYDVYCLGKVLLELVTGKLGISASNDGSTNEWLDYTLSHINIYERELLAKILDPSLIVDEDLLEEVWAMAIVAKSCLNPRPSKRPIVRYILKALENPFKVVREENNSGSGRLKAVSSWGSWNAAFMGSWRHSSSDINPPPPREDRMLKRSGTMRSQGSGEQSFHKRPSKEIFPEPSGVRDLED